MKKIISDSDQELMIECAVLHYEKELDQIAIAKELGISQRSSFSAFKGSTGKGAVQITIQRPYFKHMEDELRDLFALRDAKIIQVPKLDPKKTIIIWYDYRN